MQLTEDTPRALESTLRSLRPRLLRQANLALRDTGVAEDLVQDVLLAVVQQQDKWRQEAALQTWATAILKNKIADWYRSPGRKRMVPLGDEADDSMRTEQSLSELYDDGGAYREPVPAWQEPENTLEQREMMGALQRCVDSLPRQTGRVFMMREWLGFENREICQRTGITAENCRTILHRARTSLRTCMQRDWVEAGGRA